MTFIRRIAVPCGIAGGVLALVGVVFLASILFAHGVFATALAKFGWYPVALSLNALLGVVALVAVGRHKKQPQLARALLWVAGLTILLVSLWVDPTVFGIVFAPAYVLLTLSAIGMTPAPASRAPNHV